MEQTTAAPANIPVPGANTNSNGVVAQPGWSWSGFTFNAAFLIAIRRYKLLWWYLLMLIPVVNLIFGLAMAIYLGLKGHELGTGGGSFDNQSEYNGFFKATDHAGFVFFIIGLVIFIAWIILAIAVPFAFFLHAPKVGLPNGMPNLPVSLPTN